ncbi:hypothetical protein [Nevskia ramosa]|uniref:hypothetical protein n=1 Tax=Nevskia ramosa TaxID=64002 RepID=UPI0023529D6A|nr:hypothetical protein [Nevskia ramosa]
MKRLLRTLAPAALLFVALLAGCDDDDHRRHQPTYGDHHDPGDGAIGLDGDTVVIEAGGQPELARVGLDGALSIGETGIETSPEARTALKAYSAAAVAMKTHAIAFGRAGVGFGFDTLRDVVDGLMEGRKDVGSEAREGAEVLVVRARDLCGRMEAVQVAQQAAAEAVPAFAPYAVLDAAQVRDCFEGIDKEVRDLHDKAEPGSSGGA